MTISTNHAGHVAPRRAPHVRGALSATASALLAASLLASCATDEHALDLDALSLYALVSTVDGVAFYPPLGPEPGPFSGTFDATLLSRLEVLLEAEDGAAHVSTLGAFSAATKPGLVLLAHHDMYWMNVPAAAYFTDPALAYRFRVLLDGREIGRSDMSSRVFEVMSYVPTLAVGVKLHIEARPAPVLTILTPASATAGAENLTLTVDGSAFTSDAIVRFAGHDLATTYVSAGRLTAVVPATLLTTAGRSDVTVFVPAPGGGSSTTASFEISNPVPANVSATFSNLQSATCSIRGGLVYCAGYNAYGQLGDGTTTDRSFAAPVSGLSDVVELASGIFFACARKSDGSVWCWGHNFYGNLGDGTTTIRTRPVLASVVSNVAQVVAGYWHVCARFTNGTVQCWGHNGYGQLGDGTRTNSRYPVTVAGLTNVVELAGTNGSSTCARLSDGTLRCWGYNFWGTLGNGGTSDSSVPVVVRGISTAVQLAGGRLTTCARLADGTARCWGWNVWGQVGDGTVNFATTPVAVSGLTNVRYLAGGWSAVCAVKTDGTAWCWGSNGYGQLGDGTTTTRYTPVQVSGLANVESITANGQFHTCARLADGSGRCWGANDYGLLGDGTTARRSTPITWAY